MGDLVILDNSLFSDYMYSKLFENKKKVVCDPDEKENVNFNDAFKYYAVCEIDGNKIRLDVKSLKRKLGFHVYYDKNTKKVIVEPNRNVVNKVVNFVESVCKRDETKCYITPDIGVYSNINNKFMNPLQLAVVNAKPETVENWVTNFVRNLVRNLNASVLVDKDMEMWLGSNTYDNLKKLLSELGFPIDTDESNKIKPIISMFVDNHRIELIPNTLLTVETIKTSTIPLDEETVNKNPALKKIIKDITKAYQETHSVSEIAKKIGNKEKIQSWFGTESAVDSYIRAIANPLNSVKILTSDNDFLKEIALRTVTKDTRKLNVIDPKKLLPIVS